MSKAKQTIFGAWYRETWRSALTAVAIVLVGSLAIGGATSFAQQYLPNWLNSLSNSAGGWTMFSFLLVWLSRARPLLGLVLGVVSFESLNEGYGIVSGWRGFDYGAPFSTSWALVGLAAGPLLGIAASLTRHGDLPWKVLGVTPLAAVLLGEGIWALGHIVDTTSPIYWGLEVVLSGVFVSLALIRKRPRPAVALLVITVWLVGAACFWTLIVVLFS